MTRRRRDLLPGGLRRFLYDVHPLRERRWDAFPGIRRLEDAKGKAVLTFDDGPDPTGTPETLDALDHAGVTATFFVVGEQLARHEELGREILSRGHEIGLHCFEHQRQDLLSHAEARRDFALAMEAIENVLGVRPRWYRPPFGRSTTAASEACAEAGMSIVYWSTWGFDWEEIPAAKVARRVCRGLDDGAIALLHDSALFNERSSPEATAAAIPEIARFASQKGLKLASMAEHGI